MSTDCWTCSTGFFCFSFKTGLKLASSWCLNWQAHLSPLASVYIWAGCALHKDQKRGWVGPGLTLFCSPSHVREHRAVPTGRKGHPLLMWPGGSRLFYVFSSDLVSKKNRLFICNAHLNRKEKASKSIKFLKPQYIFKF